MESRDPPQFLFVIGQSGAGKSSFINAILGSKAARVNASESQTEECTAYLVRSGPIAPIVLVDTPGLLDDRGRDEKMGKLIAQTTKDLGIQQIKGYLVCHDLVLDRVSFPRILKSLSDHGVKWEKNLAIVLTHAAKLGTDLEDATRWRAVLDIIKREGITHDRVVVWDSKKAVEGQITKLTSVVSRMEPSKVESQTGLAVALGIAALVFCSLF